jgi:hypothetical protein
MSRKHGWLLCAVADAALCGVLAALLDLLLLYAVAALSFSPCGPGSTAGLRVEHSSIGSSAGKRMSIGQFFVEEGLLLQQRGKFILQQDGGGFWILEVDREAEEFLGCRVRAEGIRSGFNSLAVSRIVRC